MLANFITASKKSNSLEKNIAAPYLRKSFVLQNKPKKALLTIAVCGLYEVYVNGKNITKGFLAPYRSNPNHYVFLDEYNVSELLVKGDNVIAFVLGNGMQNSVVGTWDFNKFSWKSAPKVSFDLKIEYADGKTENIVSDIDVKVAKSPIYFDDFHLGEYYDARKEIKDWNKVSFDDSAWENAIITEKPNGELCPCEAEPIVARAEYKAVSVTPFESGYIYDFGTNDAGVCKLEINGERGQKIEMFHFETFKEGNPFLDIRVEDAESFQKDIYVCSGEGEERYMPRFTYHGFRYVYVKGITKSQATKNLLTFIAMSSDIKQIGKFVCDNEVVNRIQSATLLSDISNFYYFPTDCPHREKNGWTADIALSAEQMLLNFAAEKSFKTWLKNVYKAMKPSGQLPGIIPTGGWGYEWGNGPAWDCVLVCLPYFVYKYRGDESIFEGLAEPLEKYINYLYGKLNEKSLIEFGLGDWCQPNRKCEEDYSTPLVVTDSIISADIAKKAAFIFDKLGLQKQKDLALALNQKLISAIRINLYDTKNCIAFSKTQTAQAMAIYYGIFKEEEKTRAVENLVKIIRQNNDFMDVGVLGARVIFRVLAENGYAMLALKMITRPEHPSYGNWIKRGATTLWEAFWKENGRILSMNHHFWGDVSAWFYTYLAGININPTVSDIKHIDIKPCFVDDINNVESTIKLPYGELSVKWLRIDGGVALTIDFPNGAYGKLKLSDNYTDIKGNNEVVLVSGKNEFILSK